MSLNRVIETGSYTGNGTTQTITIGWQPAFILTMSDRESGGANSRGCGFKVDVQAGADYTPVSGQVDPDSADEITITSTGFTVGSEDQVNRSGNVFYWIAIKAGPWLDTGSFVGDGTSESIVLNRQVSFLFAAGADSSAGERIWAKLGGTGSSNTWNFQTSSAYAEIGHAISTSSPTTLAFQGTEVIVNGQTYVYAGFPELVGSCRHLESGSYTGDGTSQTITLGRQPKFVMIFGQNVAGDEDLAVKTGDMPATDYFDIGTAGRAGWNSAGGPDVISTGFTTGTEKSVNGETYNYLVGYE